MTRKVGIMTCQVCGKSTQILNTPTFMDWTIAHGDGHSLLSQMYWKGKKHK